MPAKFLHKTGLRASAFVASSVYMLLRRRLQYSPYVKLRTTQRFRDDAGTPLASDLHV